MLHPYCPSFLCSSFHIFRTMHLPFSLFLFFCLAYGATASADMEQIQNVAMDVFQMLMNQIGHDNKTSMEVIQTLMNQLGHDNKTSIEDIEKSFMGNILDMGTELETEGTDTINKKINMSTANKTNTKIKATDLKSISKAVDADTVSAKNKDHYKNTTSITVDNGDSKTDATVVKNETAKGNMSDWRLIDYVEHPKETIVTALKASKEKINKLTVLNFLICY